MLDYKKAYIYKLINTTNNEIYVGCSCNHTYIRLGFYRRNALKGNDGTLYEMMRALGNQQFKIIVVEECDPELVTSKRLLNARADHWRNKLDAKLTVTRAGIGRGAAKQKALKLISSPEKDSPVLPPVYNAKGQVVSSQGNIYPASDSDECYESVSPAESIRSIVKIDDIPSPVLVEKIDQNIKDVPILTPAVKIIQFSSINHVRIPITTIPFQFSQYPPRPPLLCSPCRSVPSSWVSPDTPPPRRRATNPPGSPKHFSY